mgnify:CR=1 FL=1
MNEQEDEIVVELGMTASQFKTLRWVLICWLGQYGTNESSKYKKDVEAMSSALEGEVEEQPKKQLTMDEIADIYDKKQPGRKARTLPMERVLSWAEKRTDIFGIDEEGCFYLK